MPCHTHITNTPKILKHPPFVSWYKRRVGWNCSSIAFSWAGAMSVSACVCVCVQVCVFCNADTDVFQSADLWAGGDRLTFNAGTGSRECVYFVECKGGRHEGWPLNCKNKRCQKPGNNEIFDWDLTIKRSQVVLVSKVTCHRDGLAHLHIGLSAG